MKNEVKLIRAFDRETGAALIANGMVMATVNYDEHGSAGERILQTVGESLADLLNVKFIEDEVDDEEFKTIVYGEY